MCRVEVALPRVWRRWRSGKAGAVAARWWRSLWHQVCSGHQTHRRTVSGRASASAPSVGFSVCCTSSVDAQTSFPRPGRELPRWLRGGIALPSLVPQAPRCEDAYRADSAHAVAVCASLASLRLPASDPSRPCARHVYSQRGSRSRRGSAAPGASGCCGRGQPRGWRHHPRGDAGAQPDTQSQLHFCPQQPRTAVCAAPRGVEGDVSVSL